MAAYTFKQRLPYPTYVFACRPYFLPAARGFYNYNYIYVINHNSQLRDWSAEKESNDMTKTKSAYLNSCLEMGDSDPSVDKSLRNLSLSAGFYPFHPLFVGLQENHRYDELRRNVL